MEQPIAVALRSGSHKLELTVAAEPNPRSLGRSVAIDGFVVGEEGPFPWPQVAFGGLVFVVLMGVVVWRRQRHPIVTSEDTSGRP